MGKYRIEQPDGKAFEIEAPDDLTEDQLIGLARQSLPQEFAEGNVAVRAPEVQQPVNDPEDELLNDVGAGIAELGTGVAEGAANVVDHAAGWLQSGLNAAGQAVTGSNWGDALAGDGGKLADAFSAPRPGFETTRSIGRFGGEVGATLPLAALRGGAAVQGAVGGALLSNGSDPISIGQDALIGAAGGAIANGLFRGAAQTAAPTVAPELRTLIDAGVRVTPGQAARSAGGGVGNFIARSEDRAVSTPFVGDAIMRGRNRTLDDFGRATLNRSVQPIGLELPADMQSGRRAVKWAGDRLSEAYDALLPNLSVQADQQFAADLANVQQEAATLAPQRGEQFGRILTDLQRFWQGSVLDGTALKQVETRLGDRIRRFSSSPDADQQDLGDLLSQVQQSLREAAARQNPDQATRLRAINEGYASLVQVEKASLNSRGSVTPAGYSRAVQQSSDTVRRRGYARGQALNQDLSDAGSSVLPSEIADSGTAGRWQQSNLLANLIGVPQALAYSGAQAATPLLTRQTNVSPQLAELLRRGAIAAPAITPALQAELSR